MSPNAATAEAPVTSERKQDPGMSKFQPVLKQIKLENVPSLASSIRQANEINNHVLNHDPSIVGVAPLVGCRVVNPPLHGSYNIIFKILFEDGVRWALKVAANGHREAFDHLAAQNLESEAQTMRLIKQRSTIPVPTVHSFEPTSDNPIGCPYLLMDFMKGKPLHKVWFNNEISPQRLEQIRLRCLQTVACSMVQLNLLTSPQGGSLQFDAEGNLVTVGPAKIVDSVAMYDRFEAYDDDGSAEKGDEPEDDIFCDKGPSDDTLSSLLFMLDRRGVRRRDSSFDRGVRQALRMFIPKVVERMQFDGDQYVLSHPDFNMQNLLVEDDGTLVGIIDWDGVAAVPKLVGALRYPLFLMRDWEPTFYNWDSEAGEPYQRNGYSENSPAELAGYRGMYAQFIEMALCATGLNSAQSKKLALITRSSILTGSLEIAASDPMLTAGVVSHIFKQIRRAEYLYYEEESSVDSTASSLSDHSNEEDSDDEADDLLDPLDHPNTQENELEKDPSELHTGLELKTHCPRCIAGKSKTASTGHDSESQTLAYLNEEIVHAQNCPRVNKSNLQDHKKSEPPVAGEPTEKDVWERIAREVKNCGVTTAMLRGGQRDIAAWIIESLKEKEKQEKALKEEEKKLRRKAEREARRAKRHEERMAAQKDERLSLSNEPEQVVAHIGKPISVTANPPQLLPKNLVKKDALPYHLISGMLETAVTAQDSRCSAQESKPYKDLAEALVPGPCRLETTKKNFNELGELATESSATGKVDFKDTADLVESQCGNSSHVEVEFRERETAPSESEPIEHTDSGEPSSEGQDLDRLETIKYGNIADEIVDAMLSTAEASLVDMVIGKKSSVRLSVLPRIGSVELQAAEGLLAEVKGCSVYADLAGPTDYVFPVKEAKASEEERTIASNSASPGPEFSSDDTKSSHTSQSSMKPHNEETSSPSIIVSQDRDLLGTQVDRSSEIISIRKSTHDIVNAVRLQVTEALKANRISAVTQPAVSEEGTLGKAAGNSPPSKLPDASDIGSEAPAHAEEGSHAVEEEEERNERGLFDHGGFTFSEICFALGKGNLDKHRRDRLLRDFEHLHSWTMGTW